MAYSPNYDATGISIYEHPSLKFVDGQTQPVKITYRLYGDLNASKKILIPTCFGGIINSTFTFPSLHSDHLVIVVAMLGNGESSSPSNTATFPSKLSYIDQINAQYALCRQHLSCDNLDAVVGFSMGGQQAYHWATSYPDYVKNIVVICGSAKTSTHNWTFLEGPKAALENSVDYEDGAYGERRVRPTRGLVAFARAYSAWLTSGAWFREQGWEKLGAKSVEEWIKEGPEKTYGYWDPKDLLILLRQWQAGDIGKTREDGDYKKALQDIKARVLLMPARTDQYFAVQDNEEELKWLDHAELAVIETTWGHMAGGGANEEDAKWMDQRISSFLAG